MSTSGEVQKKKPVTKPDLTLSTNQNYPDAEYIGTKGV